VVWPPQSSFGHFGALLSSLISLIGLHHFKNLTMQSTRHLDLGCGPTPRNPYQQTELYGVDIDPANTTPGVTIKQANLAVQAIPFPDQYFDSVSAFDFFEHIPRVLPTPQGDGTRFPFIELMNEVHRVLKPGGVLYALTPCYPAFEAFQDPTHVNIITDKTHKYFTGDKPLGAMYGFVGRFEVRNVDWVVHKDALTPLVPLTFSQSFRRLNYKLKGKFSHLCWEFVAH
jgi:SAM-dependent methyltransferase